MSVESNTNYRVLDDNSKEGTEFVSEYEFHRLFTEREGASFVLQGYCRMLGCESYSYMHTFLNARTLAAFVAAFGVEPKGKDVPSLWKEARSVLGLDRPEKAKKPE